MALSTSRLINVDVQLNSLAASMRGFGTLLVIGDSDVIPNSEAMRSYTNLNDVANDFGVTSAEYLAAQAYFSQDPSPDNLMIGRWYRQASAAELMGGILTDSEKQITNFNTVNNGAFKYTVNNEVRTVRGVDLTGQTNLNGVASVVSATLQGANIQYDGQRFIVTSSETGSGIALGYFTADDELVDASSALGLTMASGAQTKTGTDVVPGTPGSPEVPATAGTLTGAAITDNISTLQDIETGNFRVAVDGQPAELISGLDLSGVSSVADIVPLLELEGVTVTADEDHLILTSQTKGASSSIVVTAGDEELGSEEVPATAGTLTGTDISGNVDSLKAVTDGCFTVKIDGGEAAEVTGLNFSTVTQVSDIPALITIAGASVAASGNALVITSNSTGATSTVEVTTGTTGTDVGTLLGLVGGMAKVGTDLVPAVPSKVDVSELLGLSNGTSKPGTDLVPAVEPIPEVPATAGTLTGGNINLATLRRITNGQISINLNGSVNPVVLTNLNFSNVRSVSDIPALLTLQGASVIADGEHLLITSNTLGKQSAVSYATAGTITQAQDLSKLLKLTSELALTPTLGTDDESALAALKRLTNASADWYGAMFAASEMPSDDDLLECAEFTEGQNDITRVFGITATDTRTLDSSWEQDIASRCKAENLSRTVVQYSQNPYAIASFFGRAFTVNFSGNMTTITMMYKSEPSISAETITETQAQTLEAKRCNVFVNYNNNTSIIQYGVTSGDYWWDERHGADWLKEYIGNSIWNLFMTANTKIGQDDAGVNKIVSVINESLVQAKANGFVGAGTWNGDGFGQLSKGDYLNDGFYIYAPPMSTQSQADREQRISVPIQVAAKLLGAIHTVDVAVNLNR